MTLTEDLSAPIAEKPKAPRRRINWASAIQTLSNLALVVIAALALKVQSDVGGLQNFFQSEIEARNQQIRDIASERLAAERQLADVRTNVASAQRQQLALRSDVSRWEQAVAQSRFDTLIGSASVDSDLTYREYAAAISEIRDRSNRTPREPYPDEIGLGERLINQVESADFSDASTGVQRRLRTLRTEFLRQCSFLASRRYSPSPLAAPLTAANSAAAFSSRQNAYYAAGEALAAEARRCSSHLPSYQNHLTVN